jgi:hypothetical protein
MIKPDLRFLWFGLFLLHLASSIVLCSVCHVVVKGLVWSWTSRIGVSKKQHLKLRGRSESSAWSILVILVPLLSVVSDMSGLLFWITNG